MQKIKSIHKPHETFSITHNNYKYLQETPRSLAKKTGQW